MLSITSLSLALAHAYTDVEVRRDLDKALPIPRGFRLDKVHAVLDLVLSNRGMVVLEDNRDWNVFNLWDIVFGANAFTNNDGICVIINGIVLVIEMYSKGKRIMFMSLNGGHAFYEISSEHLA